MRRCDAFFLLRVLTPSFLPQGLTTFMGEYSTDYGVLFAGLTLSAAPITIVYILLSKQFIQGMTSGAVK